MGWEGESAGQCLDKAPVEEMASCGGESGGFLDDLQVLGGLGSDAPGLWNTRYSEIIPGFLSLAGRTVTLLQILTLWFTQRAEPTSIPLTFVGLLLDF